MSFALVMLATSVLWYFKPSISRPRYIATKNGKTVESIRGLARQHVCICGFLFSFAYSEVETNHVLQTHRQLPAQWYRTPLDFVGKEYFGINIHWAYYTRISQITHLSLFSRTVTSRPWDRFPSDTWLCPEFTYLPFAVCIQLGFSGIFLTAWNFYFPTYTEKLLWRICSVYHAFFSVYGAIYFLIEMYRSKRPLHQAHRQHPVQLQKKFPESHHPAIEYVVKSLQTAKERMQRWRNISPEQDPEMEVPLRVLVPVTIMCFLYVVTRGYIYIEDFISLREQPSGVFTDVNHFIPFLGS